MNIGFIGLVYMGSNMVKKLSKKQEVFVYSIKRGKDLGL
ncbi:MAG: NAD(P)-binding domain-containing protein [Nanoarchaeota archaeon]